MNHAFRKPRAQRSAFTIVELMVSIALVLVLMVGVSTVFRTISSTVSAGSSVSDNTRVARAAQAVFAKDFGTIVTKDAPCILLYSRSQAAYRNAADEASDRDADKLTVDVNGNNAEGDAGVAGEQISPATYNARNHRTDLFSFFVRDLLPRQTGGSETSNGTTPFVANMTASEAWIWYGHMRLPDNSLNFGTLTDPGAGTLGSNPNNYYASQWVLGREQILLREPDSGGNIKDNAGVDQIYIEATTTVPLTTSPLSYQSNANVGTYDLKSSRYDLAGTTISAYRERLRQVRATNPNPATDNWWGNIFLSNGRRFQANPYIAKPVTPAILSQQVPIFVPGCTQFIVEYAGDFLIQDNVPTSATYGQIQNVYTNVSNGDGQIDYIVVGTGATRRKIIRWYGMPRDVDGDGRVLLNANANLITDVVPLRDIWRLSTTPGVAPNQSNAPFEKFTYTGLDARATPSLKDFGAGAGEYTAAGSAGMEADDFYTCAWSANDRMPKLIRITLVVDDPAGRNPNPDGQVFEYVFELP